MSEEFVKCEYCNHSKNYIFLSMQTCPICHGTGKMLWIHKFIKPEYIKQMEVFQKTMKEMIEAHYKNVENLILQRIWVGDINE